MNRTAMLPLCLLALWLTACGTAESAAPAAPPTAAPEPTPTEPPAPPAEPAAPYSDLRYLPWLDEYVPLALALLLASSARFWYSCFPA